MFLISISRLFNPAWRVTEAVSHKIILICNLTTFLINIQLDGTRQRFGEAKRVLSTIIDELIQHHTSSERLPNLAETDYLTALLEDKKEQDLDSVRDTLTTLFFAGKDSTQNAILWALYELIRSPQWIDLMREEFSSCPPKGVDGVISYGELQASILSMTCCIS